jgi:Rrf2 family transcriptional regulator, iron-sulfur cluster assembly transcription factor
MRLNTQSRFAVTAMIDIALRDNAGPISLAEIGARHHISLSYLEHLFSKLRRCGLVESTRGPGGGYSLARSGEAISVADIIGAVETDPNQTGRLEKTARQPDGSGSGVTQDLWASLNAKMVEHMQSISLRKLVAEQRAKGVQIEDRPAKKGVGKAPKRQTGFSTAPNSVFALGRSLLAGS